MQINKMPIISAFPVRGMALRVILTHMLPLRKQEREVVAFFRLARLMGADIPCYRGFVQVFGVKGCDCISLT